jgi:hypothetical protein
MASAVGAVNETHDLGRYQAIIDRAPFCAVAASTAAAAQPNFANRYIFVGVVSTTEDNRPLAIIQDKERNNRIYFKAEGETIDSVKVMRIEQSPAKLVLQQGLEVATLSYQGSAGGPSPTPTAGMAHPTPGTLAPGMPAQPPGAPRRIPFRRGGNQ